jgi:phosphoribosyl 1,2-cyclic phosphodiesterase
MVPQALSFAQQADTVVIESNYDLEMLRNGPYPKVLQDRICGGHGHLSNAECAEALRSFAHPGLRNVFLCHLSEHNNTPELAYQTNSTILQELYAESDERIPRLCPLPRLTPSPMFVL